MSKKKITDPTASMEELIQRAVQLAEAPFTPDRKPELPSLRSVAEQLGTTVIRTRKLLITAGYFTSPTASTVQRLKAEGQSIEEIGAALRLKPAAVYGYLPYENLAYNLPQTTSNADRHIMTILEAMHQIIDIQMERNQWTEVMFDQLFRNGLIEAMPLDIKGEAWYEIDTYEDLSNAEMLFNSRMHEVMNRKVFFIDKDGTISLNNKSIPGAAETINFLREQGKKVYILSNNSSRTAFEHSRSLKSLGIEAAVDEIIISTDACIHYLISNKLNRIALLANDAVRDYFERRGFEIDDQCPEAAVATYDDTLTYQKLIKFIDVIRTGIPYYATHIDLVYPTERGPIPDIGCIIDMITRSTGKRPLLTFGKPSLELIKPILAKNSMGFSDAVIVGDRLYTDIAMGLGNELITVLVLSGETNRDEYEFSQIRADIVVPSIAYLVKDWG